MCGEKAEMKKKVWTCWKKDKLWDNQESKGDSEWREAEEEVVEQEKVGGRYEKEI